MRDIYIYAYRDRWARYRFPSIVNSHVYVHEIAIKLLSLSLLRGKNYACSAYIKEKCTLLKQKQFHGFRLGFTATTDSGTAGRSGSRSGTSSATVNFTGRFVPTDIGGKRTKLVRNSISFK